jgi:hypothetical protein
MSGGPTSRSETIRSNAEAEHDGSVLIWLEEKVTHGPLTDAERRFFRDAYDTCNARMMEWVIEELGAARAEGREPDEFEMADLVWTKEHGRPTTYVPGRRSTYPAQITDGTERNGQ